jgi:hypothetical protein
MKSGPGGLEGETSTNEAQSWLVVGLVGARVVSGCSEHWKRVIGRAAGFETAMNWLQEVDVDGGAVRKAEDDTEPLYDPGRFLVPGVAYPQRHV